MKLLYRWLNVLFMTVLFISCVYSAGPSLVLKNSLSDHLFRPTRIAVNADGAIAVADYHRKQVYLFNNNSQFLSSVAVSQPPLSIAFASDGNLYIGITEDVLRVSTNGTVLDKFSSHSLSVHLPIGIAVDKNGIVYIADKEANQIVVCSSNGEKQFSFGTFGTQNSEFRSPSGIAIDQTNGDVIIADAGNSRVQVFSSRGEFQRSFGEHIKQIDTTWKMVGTFAQMQGIAVDQQHRIYVTDSGLDHVQIFDSFGNHLGFLGREEHISARFRVPIGITVSGNGGLFIASMASSEVKEYSIQNATEVGTLPITLPPSFVLEQNFPNPFNPMTQIKFDLPSEGFVVLKIYDIVGREVKTLANEQYQAGKYTVAWDGRDNVGSEVSSGIYFYQIQVDNKFTQTNKMLFLK